MTTPTRPQIPLQRIDPSICRKEVSLSSALMPEGAEYVGYFCGVEFYEELVTKQSYNKLAKPQK